MAKFLSSQEDYDKAVKQLAKKGITDPTPKRITKKIQKNADKAQTEAALRVKAEAEARKREEEGIMSREVTTDPAPPFKPDKITPPSINADSYFQLESADINRKLAEQLAQYDEMYRQYEQQNTEQLKNLGWTEGLGWDPNDRLSTYGNTFQGNEGDFAGRGAYYSGLYANSVDDIDRSFDRQKSGMDAALARYESTMNLNKSQAESERDSKLALARRTAADRIQRELTAKNMGSDPNLLG